MGRYELGAIRMDKKAYDTRRYERRGKGTKKNGKKRLPTIKFSDKGKPWNKEVTFK